MDGLAGESGYIGWGWGGGGRMGYIIGKKSFEGTQDMGKGKEEKKEKKKKKAGKEKKEKKDLRGKGVEPER